MTMAILEKRASTVLFRFLKSNPTSGVYLLPANVCPIVPAVFRKANVPFELLDIHQATLALDPELVLHRLRRGGCAGVLYVRTYGAVFDMESYFKAFKEASPSLLLIDDRCLATPRFKHSGGCADLELYSTGYSKFVDLSWGGWGHLAEGRHYEQMAMPYSTQAHEDLVAQFRRFRERSARFEYTDSDWLDASEVCTSWQEFETLVRARAENAAAHRAALNKCYRNFLPQEYCLPEAFWNWRFHVWVSEPMAVLKLIFDAGLFASSHYTSLVPAFGSGHVPRTVLLGSKVVNLFNDFRFDLERAEHAARLVADFLKTSGQKPYPWSYANTTTN